MRKTEHLLKVEPRGLKSNPLSILSFINNVQIAES